MALNLNKQREAAAQATTNFNETRAGGGDYQPPEAGAARARLIGYIETGVHSSTFKGAKKTKPRAQLLFELSGPKHQPKDGEGDKKIPHRITIYETVGNHEKNGIVKLFKLLKQETGCEEANNFVDLLIDKAWRCTVVHVTKEVDGAKKTRAYLREKDSGYTFKPTAYDDEESGERKQVKVAEAISEPRLFLWNAPDLDQWDSLFIDGTNDDGSSKNRFQEEIKKAENFVGSPIHTLLIEAGREAETVRAAKVEKDETSGGEDEDEAAADKVTKPVKQKTALEQDDGADPLADVS